MAKTNNLTDFLTGLADKFRSKLGGSALINPQDFESKIDEVYQKGYADAPQGTDTSDATATAADIFSGKTAYAKGKKLTGTAPDVEYREFTPETDIDIDGYTINVKKQPKYVNLLLTAPAGVAGISSKHCVHDIKLDFVNEQTTFIYRGSSPTLATRTLAQVVTYADGVITLKDLTVSGNRYLYSGKTYQLIIEY